MKKFYITIRVESVVEPNNSASISDLVEAQDQRDAILKLAQLIPEVK